MGYQRNIYGLDLLSLLLILLGSILNIWHPTRFLSLIPVLYAIYRTVSRDIYKRKNEYDKFVAFANKGLSKIGLSIPNNLQPITLSSLSSLNYRWKQARAQHKKYKNLICPKCKKRFMVPRGRGKVIITCKACHTEFKARV